MCAIRVARRTRRHGGKVTLVDPAARFAERSRMHQIASYSIIPAGDDAGSGPGLSPTRR